MVLQCVHHLWDTLSNKPGTPCTVFVMHSNSNFLILRHCEFSAWSPTELVGGQSLTSHSWASLTRAKEAFLLIALCGLNDSSRVALPSSFSPSPAMQYESPLITSDWPLANALKTFLSFPQNLQFEFIKEEVGYGTIDLLCDIGGTLSLLMGASVLTCCELFEVAWCTIVNKCCIKGKKRIVKRLSTRRSKRRARSRSRSRSLDLRMRLNADRENGDL